jgi:salicylate hydroxylase
VDHKWGEESRPLEELLAPYPELDPQVRGHLSLGKDIQPWRLWMQYVQMLYQKGFPLIFFSDPYPYIKKGVVCLLGDAAHPVSDLWLLIYEWKMRPMIVIYSDDAPSKPRSMYGS